MFREKSNNSIKYSILLMHNFPSLYIYIYFFFNCDTQEARLEYSEYIITTDQHVSNPTFKPSYQHHYKNIIKQIVFFVDE